MSATLTIISWRDIPAQVSAKSGRSRAAAELSPRFQAAIDRAAMNAGLAGSDGYLEEWHKQDRACTEDLEREVSTEIQRLEAAHPPAMLNAMAANGGLRPAEEGASP